MNRITPRSGRPKGQRTALRQLTGSELSSTPALDAITRGDYGVSKLFQSDALAAMAESSRALSASFSAPLLESLTDQRVSNALTNLSTSLSYVSSSSRAALLDALDTYPVNSIQSLLESNSQVLLNDSVLDSLRSLPTSLLSEDITSLASTTFADNINAITSGIAAPLSSVEALESLRFSFLDSLNPDLIQAWITDLDEDPDLVEQVFSVGTTDPFHQALLETAARWASVTAMSGLYLYDASIETTEKILTGVAIIAFSSLVQLLIPIYGISGYVVAVILMGAAQQVSPKKRSNLSGEGRRALQLTCPYCSAVPDMWCIVTRGESFGDDARHLHRKRYLALLDDHVDPHT